MNLVIHSIKSREIITPYTEHLCGDSKKYVFIKSSDEITIESFGNEKAILPPGAVLISKKVKIYNHLPTFTVIRGFVFSFKNKDFDINSPIILPVHDWQHRLSINQIDYLFDNNPLSTKMIQEISETFLNLLRSIKGTIEENKKYVLHGKIDPRLLWINRVIRKKYYEPLTLESLSTVIQCNPVYLSNTYSKVFKISPMKYLQTVRMQKAKEFLENTDLSVKEIAQSVGYMYI